VHLSTLDHSIIKVVKIKHREGENAEKELRFFLTEVMPPLAKVNS
jgi:hypothetical protein